MNRTALVVNSTTGELLTLDDGLELFTVPEDRDDMLAACNFEQRAAYSHHWRTAAMVYAWTEEGTGGPRSTGGKTSQLSLREFAELGIRGLVDRGTVARYRAAMQRAIDDGLTQAPTPGGSILLPTVPFEPRPALSSMFSSDSNEWYTPETYLESARAVLGRIDLDPASCEAANQRVRAVQFFTEADDGLTRDWHGRVFLNPPYGVEGGESRAGLFCRKAIDEYGAGRVTAAILLVNSVHSQSWQRPLYEFPVCLVDHRIEFIDGANDRNPNPTFANVFVYLGREVQRFAQEFRKHGYCVEKIP